MQPPQSSELSESSESTLQQGSTLHRQRESRIRAASAEMSFQLFRARECGDVSKKNIKKDFKTSKLADGRTLKRRNPSSHLLRKKNDVYVDSKIPLKILFQTCEKLLDTETEIIVHGLGAAIVNTINLALLLQQQHINTLQISVNTSTVELIDDIQPEADAFETETQKRLNSAVHIRIWHVKKVT
ncbi:hypothetical protein B566_EDAN008115 [Ephemera danica]|nr:hypothetical protein B566_EDAN008115 [Ephemera danica]